jgi:hypothetical protein
VWAGGCDADALSRSGAVERRVLVAHQRSEVTIPSWLREQLAQAILASIRRDVEARAVVGGGAHNHRFLGPPPRHAGRAVRDTSPVARIDRTFSMQMAPEQAQALFASDIAPELHRAGGFVRYKEEPGYLAFSDGIVDPMAFAGRDGFDYSMLRRLLAHRIKVDFVQEVAGTRVTVRGSAALEIRDAINRLGQAGHWPSNRDDPHA